MPTPTERAASVVLADILATETSGRPVTAGQYWALYGLVGGDSSLARHQAVRAALTAARGVIGSPDGSHGPFPANRCVYCGSNDLDVELYTVDPAECPPRWACAARHPDETLATCRLEPDHADDHFAEWLDWPELPDPDDRAADGDDEPEWVAVAGPPQRRTLTWA